MFPGFARLRESLTVVVFLRRISRELHRANELAEARLKIQYPAAYKAFKSGRGPAKVAEISVASVQDWNDAWNESHPQEEEE